VRQPNPFAPEGRLADPSPTLQDQRGRTCGEAAEKPIQLGQFGFSANDLVGRHIKESAAEIIRA
jgi:hypothetical protein